MMSSIALRSAGATPPKAGEGSGGQATADKAGFSDVLNGAAKAVAKAKAVDRNNGDTTATGTGKDVGDAEAGAPAETGAASPFAALMASIAGGPSSGLHPAEPESEPAEPKPGDDGKSLDAAGVLALAAAAAGVPGQAATPTAAPGRDAAPAPADARTGATVRTEATTAAIATTGLPATVSAAQATAATAPVGTPVPQPVAAKRPLPSGSAPLVGAAATEPGPVRFADAPAATVAVATPDAAVPARPGLDHAASATVPTDGPPGTTAEAAAAGASPKEATASVTPQPRKPAATAPANPATVLAATEAPRGLRDDAPQANPGAPQPDEHAQASAVSPVAASVEVKAVATDRDATSQVLQALSSLGLAARAAAEQPAGGGSAPAGSATPDQVATQAGMSGEVDPAKAARLTPGTVTIALHPEALGRVTVTVRMHGDDLEVRIAADRADTQALLTRDRHQIEAAVAPVNGRLDFGTGLTDDSRPGTGSPDGRGAAAADGSGSRGGTSGRRNDQPSKSGQAHGSDHGAPSAPPLRRDGSLYL